MIILVDMEAKKVRVYSDNGVQVIPFNKSELLKQLIGNKEVLYVTKATKTTGNEIYKMMVKLSSNTLAVGGEPKNDEPLYIRSSSGHLYFADINLSLDGPGDCVPLIKIYEKYGKDILQNHSLIKTLIQQGKIEILTLSEVQYHLKKKAEADKIKDQKLESLIVDREKLADKGSSNIIDDAIEIDIGGSGSIGRGGSSNEGSLLPEDF